MASIPAVSEAGTQRLLSFRSAHSAILRVEWDWAEQRLIQQQSLRLETKQADRI